MRAIFNLVLSLSKDVAATRHNFIALGLGLIGFLPIAASAQTCTVTSTTLNFGIVNLAANTVFNTTGTLAAVCTGIGGRTVRICPNFNAGSGGSNTTGSLRYMLRGATQLQYNIHSNAAQTTIWGSYLWPGVSFTPPTINLNLNGAGTGSTTFTVRARIFANQTTLPAGPYSSSFAGTQTVVKYAYSTVGICSVISNSAATRSTTSPFVVLASNGSSCTVSATDLDFGTTGLLDSNIDAANAITASCTNGLPYSVSLNGGLAGATDPTQRKMSNVAVTGQVTYGIYRNVLRTLPFGNIIGTNTLAGTGTGLAQIFTGFGRVPPQSTPAPDLYRDTVVVTVTF